jgi:SAM-dependent methyltransferase
MAAMTHAPTDRWSEGDPYEQYVGRWSRRVAPIFVQWLGVAPNGDWADVGCGTGALTEAILHAGGPRAIDAVDRSAGFLATAQSRIHDARVRFHVADASALPVADASCDAAVSGLVLNFVAEPASMVSELRRVTRPGGCVAVYVWDYAQGMQMMRLFWDAARTVDPAGAPDEGSRFPICAPEPMAQLWRDAGLVSVEVRAIDIDTDFRDFDDFWTPFTGGQGAAPSYLATLGEAQQAAIRDVLLAAVPRDADGAIRLRARAWAVKGLRAAAS